MQDCAAVSANVEIFLSFLPLPPSSHANNNLGVVLPHLTLLSLFR